jgi:glycosyltransferase involved in cell wall biosynthesis
VRPLRIAWTGSAVGDLDVGSSVALGGRLLGQALEHGVEVDLYHPAPRSELPAWLLDHPGLTVVEEPVRFTWGRWYSSNPISVFLSGSAARIRTQVRLGRRLIANHRRRRYDAVFQFSQTELFVLGRGGGRVPPIVVHPCTTASGELRWHRRERAYALQSESRARHYIARAVLEARSRVQRRELRKPRLVAGPSAIFNRLMCADYGVDLARTRVLRHPVDATRFAGVERRPAEGRPIVLLYAARLSARKGFELITALSHRLADLEGDVRIKVMAGGSLWSDYSAHLADLHPGVAEQAPGVAPGEMPAIYADADVLLVPSHYEPGSLVVGEALAAGVPVVASDQVGPVEILDERVCRVFADGDLDAFEGEVRRLVAELRAGEGEAIAADARRAAVERFAPERIGRDLVAILEEAAGRGPTEPEQPHAVHPEQPVRA